MTGRQTIEPEAVGVHIQAQQRVAFLKEDPSFHLCFERHLELALHECLGKV